jgi:hypothetical protein
MTRRGHRRGRARAIVWGVILMAIGTVLLLDRFGTVQLPRIGQLWPLIFVALGISKTFERDFGSALMFILVGAWVLACNSGWNELTYGNSWPIVVVIFGIKLVVESLSGGNRRGGHSGGGCRG